MIRGPVPEIVPRMVPAFGAGVRRRRRKLVTRLRPVRPLAASGGQLVLNRPSARRKRRKGRSS